MLAPALNVICIRFIEEVNHLDQSLSAMKRILIVGNNTGCGIANGRGPGATASAEALTWASYDETTFTSRLCYLASGDRPLPSQG